MNLCKIPSNLEMRKRVKTHLQRHLCVCWCLCLCLYMSVWADKRVMTGSPGPDTRPQPHYPHTDTDYTCDIGRPPHWPLDQWDTAGTHWTPATQADWLILVVILHSLSWARWAIWARCPWHLCYSFIRAHVCHQATQSPGFVTRRHRALGLSPGDTEPWVCHQATQSPRFVTRRHRALGLSPGDTEP